MKVIYLRGNYVEDWLSLEIKEVKGPSNVRKTMLKVAPLVGKWTA